MSLLEDRSLKPVRIISLLACFAKEGGGSTMVVDLPHQYHLVSSTNGRQHVAYRERKQYSGTSRDPAFPGLMILGDDWEAGPEFDGLAMANATAVACRLERGRLEALTAIPGLPPLYLAETACAVVVTSDLFLLKCIEGMSLRFDPAAVVDLARVGRPVAHRTMFAGVRMIPGGTRLSLDAGLLETREAWNPPGRAALERWDDYTALQAEAFGRVAAGLDYRDCVLSLTAGLDTRAILSGLIANEATVPALTVSGEAECLDARTAARLCAGYGMEHRTIRLDETFCRVLPELATRASLLSGGITSVGHAGQVHCYSLLGDPAPDKMLSGYLGNQIGRLGTEGLTVRNADTSLLSQDLKRAKGIERPPESWYAEAMQPDGHLEPRFLIQQESMFGNLASYAIGNSHSVQQSTYGSRALIENLWRMPTAEIEAQGSARFHDLKHRFFGESLRESFQRRYINSVGGLAARYPVNWGWRSEGGVSLGGLWWGGLALVDAIVASRFSETPAMTLIRALGIAGLHEYRPVHRWMHRHLRDFVYDELRSRDTVEAGLFDSAVLERKLDDYYAGAGQGYGDVLLALDLALAARNFQATA